MKSSSTGMSRPTMIICVPATMLAIALCGLGYIHAFDDVAKLTQELRKCKECKTEHGDEPVEKPEESDHSKLVRQLLDRFGGQHLIPTPR